MSIIFHYIFQYFWFGCAAFWLILIFMQIPFTMKSYIASGSITQFELHQFQKRLAYAITCPLLLLGVLQIIGGHATPFYIVNFSPHELTVLGSWLVLFSSWILLFFLIWFRNGAEYLSKFAPALNFPRNPNVIRICLTVGIIVSVCSFILQVMKIFPSATMAIEITARK